MPRKKPARRTRSGRLLLTPEAYLALANLACSCPQPGKFWANLSPALRQALVDFEREREERVRRRHEQSGIVVILDRAGLSPVLCRLS